MKSGSLAKPVVFSSAKTVPGRSARSRAATASSTSAGMVRAVRTSRRATSYTIPPLLQIARPCPPTASHSSSIQRMGRPVVKTTGTPAASSSSSTARVRTETRPSESSSVPSRSVATSRGALTRRPGPTG